MTLDLTPELFALIGVIGAIIGFYLKIERRIITVEVNQNLILHHLGVKKHFQNGVSEDSKSNANNTV